MATQPLMGSAYKAVFWDNDGILVDTEPLFLAASIDAFNAFDVPISRGQWIKAFLEKGFTTTEIAQSLGMGPRTISELVSFRDLLYESRIDAGITLRPKIADCVTKMPDNVSNFVVTGLRRPELLKMHRTTNILARFTSIITREDYPHPKPAPDPYVAAVRRSGLPAACCVAIEDSPKGAQSALAAGIQCIVFATELTKALKFPRGCRITSDPTDVISQFIEETPTGPPSLPGLSPGIGID